MFWTFVLQRFQGLLGVAPLFPSHFNSGGVSSYSLFSSLSVFVWVCFQLSPLFIFPSMSGFFPSFPTSFLLDALPFRPPDGEHGGGLSSFHSLHFPQLKFFPIGGSSHPLFLSNGPLVLACGSRKARQDFHPSIFNSGFFFFTLILPLRLGH